MIINKLSFITFALLLCLCIGIVNADTGILSSSSLEQVQVVNLGGVPSTQFGGTKCINLSVNDISAVNGVYFVLFQQTLDVGAYNLGNNGTGTQGSTRFTSIYGNGEIGYQIVNTPTKHGYVYIWFDNPIRTNEIGAKAFSLSYDTKSVGDVYWYSTVSSVANVKDRKYAAYFLSPTMSPISNPSGTSSGTATSMNGVDTLTYFNNVNRTFINSWSANLGGLGAIGNVIKTIDNITSASQVYVYDGSNNILASEAGITSTNFTFNVMTYPIYIKIKDAFNVYHNTSLLLNTGSQYYLSFNPITPYPNSTITVSITTNLPVDTLSNLKYIAMYAKSSYNAGNTMMVKNISGQDINFLKNSLGIWGRYNGTVGYIFDMGSITPNNFGFVLPASGNWTVTTTLEDMNGIQSEFVNNINVLGNVGQLSLTIYPIDGYDGSFISGSKVNVLDTQTNTWTNKTVINAWDCQFPVSTGFYKYVVFAPSGSAYKSTNQGNVEGVFITNEDVFTSVTLFPLTEDEIIGDITNSTVYVGVKEPEQLKPIFGATVSISPSGKTATTNSVGIATFQLTNGTAYKATASASGYQTTSVSFTPNSATYSFDIALGSGGVVPTGYGYLTPVYTTVTPSPTKTLPNYGINVTCQNYNNITTLRGLFENAAACNGVRTQGNADILIAALIILVCAGIVAYKGKGIGALVGAVIGFVISIALELLPFWLFIAVIIIAAIVLAAIITKRDG